MLAIFLFLLSFLLRTYNMGLIPFSSDSGRDFLAVRNIIQTHQFPLLGPPTSLGWLHLGPPYYIWMPTLALSRGNPEGVAFFTALIDSLVAPVIFYFFTKSIGKKASTIAALFYATSPLIIIWARIPLHPSLAPIFSVILLILLNKWRENPSLKLNALVGLVSGLLLQLHLSSVTLILFTFAYLLFHSRNRIRLGLISLCVPTLLTFLPLLFFDMASRFIMTRQLLLWVLYRPLSAIGLVDSRHLISVTSTLSVVKELTNIVQLMIYPENTVIYLAIISVSLIGMLTKCNNLRWLPRYCALVATISALTFVLFGSVQEHYLTFLFPIISLLFSTSISGLSRLFGKVSIIAFLLIISLNIFNLINHSYYLSFNANSSSRYGPPLQTQEKIVDWIASRANNQSFSLHPRPDIVNLPDYLDNYLYLFLWRWYKTPTENGNLVFTVYDVWPYPILTLPPKSEIKLFSASAVVLTQEQK